MSQTTKRIFWVVLVAILITYPWVFGIYYTNILVIFVVFSLYAVSLNLLLGYTGLLLFGHAMFFGVGGYATALALTHIEGLPLLLAVAVGPLTSIILAVILCPILARVSGTAFAMLTLAFGLLMHVLCLKLRHITGGEDGVGGFPVPSFNIPGILSIEMTDPLRFYYFAMAVLIICLYAAWFFTKTPFGSVIVSIRDNAMRVDYMGFKVPNSKAVVIVVAACFAGVAGSIYALFQNMVSADGVFGILISFTPLMAAVVGGMGSFIGPILGTALFSVMEELISRYTERVELVSGLVLIVFIVFAPMGITGLIKIAKVKYFSKEGTT